MELPRDQRRQHDADEHVRQQDFQPPRQPAEQHHHRGRPHAQRDRGPFDGLSRSQGRERGPQPHNEELVVGARLLDAEQVGHLAERHQQAGPRHEAEDDRFRDVARQVAQLEQGDDHLKAADHEAEQENRLHVLVLRLRVQRQAGDGAEDDKRDGVRWPIDEVRRRAEQRRDGGHDDGGVEAVHRRDAGDLGVGHRLRQGDGGHGEAGDQIAAQAGAAIGGESVRQLDICHSIVSTPQADGLRDGVSINACRSVVTPQSRRVAASGRYLPT